jgi:hypothetical protein
VATAAAAAVLAATAPSDHAGAGGINPDPSSSHSSTSAAFGGGFQITSPAARPLVRAPPPISVSGDPVKDKLINELLKKGASEDMLYQVLSRYEAAKARKMQSRRAQSSNVYQQPHHSRHTDVLRPSFSTQPAGNTNPGVKLDLGKLPPGTSAAAATHASFPPTTSLLAANTNNPIVARRLLNARPIGPATVDVFEFESPAIEDTTRRKNFDARRKTTSLVGLDDISPRSNKKHVLPRQAVSGAAGTGFDGFNQPFQGEEGGAAAKNWLVESRPNRKRMLDIGLLDTTGDLRGSWTEMSDYRGEPERRPSRKKESPRAAQDFGKTRVLDGEYGNMSPGAGRRLQAGYPEVKGNRNFDGPEKREDRGRGGDGFRGQFARAQRMMSKSMDQWKITSAR